MRLSQKDRNIVHLGQGKACFLVSFVLSDKALNAAEAEHLPKSVQDALAQASRYPEGRKMACAW